MTDVRREVSAHSLLFSDSATSSFETHCTIMIWTIYICYLRKCSSLFLITSIILWFITATTLEKGFFVHIMEGSYLHVFFIFCCLCLIFL